MTLLVLVTIVVLPVSELVVLLKVMGFEILPDLIILYISPVPIDTTYKYPSGPTIRLVIPPKPSPNIIGSAIGRSPEDIDLAFPVYLM